MSIETILTSLSEGYQWEWKIFVLRTACYVFCILLGFAQLDVLSRSLWSNFSSLEFLLLQQRQAWSLLGVCLCPLPSLHTEQGEADMVFAV